MSIPEEHLNRLQQSQSETPPPPETEQQEVELKGEEAKRVLAELDSLKTTVQAQSQQLTKAQDAFLALINQPEAEAAEEPEVEPDWDKMDAKGLTKFIIDHVDKSQRQIAERLGTAIVSMKLESQIERVADRVGWAKFMSHKDDIVAKYREKNGTLTVAEAYTLVTGEKVSGLGSRAADTSNGGGKDGGGGDRRSEPQAQQQTPRSSGGTGRKSPAPKSMREAASTSFREIFGRDPGR